METTLVPKCTFEKALCERGKPAVAGGGLRIRYFCPLTTDHFRFSYLYDISVFDEQDENQAQR